MAYLLQCATGNSDNSATWAVCHATGLLDSQAGSSVLGTSFTASANFTPGAITIDGIAVKVHSRSVTPTGTFILKLYNATGAADVAGTTVTIDVQDIPYWNATIVGAGSAVTGCAIGWVFMKFAAPVTLSAATNYNVQCRTTSVNQVTLFRDSTSNNHSRLLRTTTTQAIAASDSFFSVPEYTGQGTKNTLTLTWNHEVNTDFGGASTTLASFAVSGGNTVTVPSTASKNYICRLSGVMVQWMGGITDFSPLDITSTLTFEFDCAADSDFGFISYQQIGTGGVGSWAGKPRTSGKPVSWALMTADTAASATSFSVDQDTGWKSGDTIGITTGRSARNESEVKILNSDAGASSVDITVAASNIHKGTAPIKQSEVVLLSRQITWRAVTSSAQMYMFFYQPVEASWMAFWYPGGAASGSFRLEGLSGTTFASSFEHCAFYEYERQLLTLSDANVEVELDNCVFWTSTNGIDHVTMGSQNQRGTLTNSVFVATANGTGLNSVSFASAGNSSLLIEDCRFAGAGWVATSSSITRAEIHVIGCNVHSGPNAVGPTSFGGSGTIFAEMRDTYYWLARSTTTAGSLNIAAGDATYCNIHNCHWRGADVNNVGIQSTGNSRIRFTECSFNSDADLTASNNVIFPASMNTPVEFTDCAFSDQVATTTDIANNGAGIYQTQLTLVNCTFGAATAIANTILTSLTGEAYVAAQKYNGGTGINWQRVMGGRYDADQLVFRTNAPSEKLSCTNALVGTRTTTSPHLFRSTVARKAVLSGKTITVSVWVRVSSDFDGGANEALPQLRMLPNGAIGIGAEVTLDTHSGTPDTWEELTGSMSAPADEDGVVEFYVGIASNAGSAYVDDWSMVSD